VVTQYGFYHNNNECIGCKMCIVACKDKNDLPLGEKYRRVYDYGGGSWDIDETGAMRSNNFFTYSVSIACNHCASPACFAVCPVGAIVKRPDGIVYIEKENCIGCEACIPACPYDAPYMSQISSVANKCDLCMDLIDAGENPVCVQSCPMRCLEYGELEELKAAHGDVNAVPPVPENTGTEPSVVFTRNRLNPDGTLPGEIINAPEEILSETVV
jgi:anaerobic dimethyl sulfoxide reductase subunit B (iron-sulfur subunit)